MTNFTQDVTIDFESSLLVNFLPISNLRLLIDNDGSDWTDATVVSGATLNGTRIEFAGINFNTLSKKYFTLATIDAINTPLPVYLISLIGESIERNNKISWTINPKEDVDHYIIEKSYNNNFTEFASIASSDSRVNQSNTLDYQWLDMNVSENMSYYKLKVVYSEGRTESLGIVSVKNKPTRMVTFSPNPVSDILTLKFAGESQYPSKIDIINQNGKVVYTTEEIDSVNIALNIGSLCSGFYYFSLTYEDSIVIEKFIKID